MMKWFRKHNKQLLAVFASALLVVWLGGTALRSMFQPNPAKRTIGTAQNRKMTVGDARMLTAKLDLLRDLGVPVDRPWLNPWVLRQLGLPVQSLQRDPIATAGAVPLDREPAAWWLLELEAQRMGLSVSQEQIKRFLAGRRIPPAVLRRVRDRYRMSTEGMLAAIGEYLRVCYAAAMASSAVQVTEPEVRDLFIRTNEKVKIRLVLLPANAKAFLVEDEPIPEEELQALFEKYRENPPGSGKYGFGYRRPDQVNVEYAGAELESIIPAMPLASDRRARNYWQRNQEKFKPTGPAATQPAATQPAAQFELVKEQVIEYLRRMDALRVLSGAVQSIKAAALELYIRLGRDLKEGQPVPEALAKIMEQETKRISKAKNIPLRFRRTGLIDAEKANNEPGIRNAWIPEGKEPLYFADYIFRVDKLFQPAGPEDTRIHFAMFQPTVIRDRVNGTDRGLYVMRVIDAVPSHPPKSLDEVRDAVLRDARILRAYKRAQQAARKLLAQAEDGGLAAAFAEQFPTLATQPATTQPSGTGLKLLEPEPFARERLLPPIFTVLTTEMTRPTRVPGVGASAELLAACFDMVASTSTQASTRLRLVELPALKAWAVVELVEHLPANEQEYRKQRPSLMSLLRFMKLKRFYADWFHPESIKRRNGWQVAKQD